MLASTKTSFSMIDQVRFSSRVTNNIELIDGVVGYKDLNHRLVHANKKLLEYNGYKNVRDIEDKTDCELIWADFSEIYHKQERDALNDIIYPALHPGTDKNGRFFLFFNRKYPWKNEQQENIGIICHSVEIEDIDFLKKIYHVVKSTGIDVQKPYYLNHPFLQRISSRESECLFYLIRGNTAKEIARQLSLSYRTVEQHIDSLKRKFSCRNKSELISYALKHEYNLYIPQRLLG